VENFLLAKYNFPLVIMTWILWKRIEIEQELILETNSYEAVSSESKSKLDEDTVWQLTVTIMH
jgi:hypothetical protein